MQGWLFHVIAIISVDVQNVVIKGLGLDYSINYEDCCCTAANELNVNVNNKLMSIILNNCHTTSVQRPVQRQGLCGVIRLLFVIFATFGILHIRLFRPLTRLHYYHSMQCFWFKNYSYTIMPIIALD